MHNAGAGSSPDDRHPPVSTYELLSAVKQHGQGWPAALSNHGLDAVAEAVSREIRAGNLRDGVTLTEQGARLLIEVRARRRLG